MDKAADAQHQYHDEVVVAYALADSNNPANYHHGQYQLAVLNYTNGNTPDVTTALDSSGNKFMDSFLPFDNILGVAVGDFDNDGNNEVAVAYIGHDLQSVAFGGVVIVDTYRYATASNGRHTLRLVGQGTGPSIPDSLSTGINLLGTISVKAGDFNGDGADELAVGYGYLQHVINSTYTPALAIFQFDSKLTPRQKGSVLLSPITAPQTPRVEVASGQFLFDPPAVQFGRRQLALAWNDVHTQGIDIQAYSVSDDLNTLTPIGGRLSVTAALSGPPLQQFSLIAGGFLGNSNSQPISSLALSFWTPGVYQVNTIAVGAKGLSVADGRTYATAGLDPTSRVPLVATDWDGKSVYLGAPAHITISGAVSTDFILEEPPKHAYFDENTKQVVTVTRYDSNNVHLNNGQTTKVSGTSTDHTNWAIGGSASVSAGATYGVDGDVGIVKVKADASIDVTAKGSYDYNQNKDTYNNQYGQREIDSSGQTDHDDYLKGRNQNFDVWRYRIYGVRQDSPQTNNFYDVILPAQTTKFDDGGLNFDWYQPIHENGNILSYPEALGKTSGDSYLPSDMGTFTLADGKAGTGPQVPASLNYFDGTGDSSTLSYSSEVSKGDSFTYSKTLAESLDVKAAVKGSITVVDVNAEQRISADAEFHNSNSWGNTTTNDTTTTSSTAITLNRSSGDGSLTYPFYPVVYTTMDGTVKMSFAVPNPAAQDSNHAGFNFWAQTYGPKPDPALNLVRRFSPAYSTETNLLNGWTPNFIVNRKNMRGLFFRKSNLNPVTNTYDFLGDAPKDGDTIRIEARVYNYSTAQTAHKIPVVFQAIPWDSSVDSEICSNPINGKPGDKGGLICPASARTTIGQIAIPQLNPLQFTCLNGTDDPAVTGCSINAAFIDWNTKGFGPASGTTQYRIYVVLDPNNTIDQTYGGEGPPVAITSVTNTSPMVVTTATPHGLSTGDRVIIGQAQGLVEANGLPTITWISPTSFSLDGSRPGQKAYSGGGTATLFDPGQNNEGFGYVNVASKPLPGDIQDPGTSADNYLAADSLQAIDYRTAALTGSVTAYQNRPLQIRVTTFSSVAHPLGAQLLLFDGDPADGATAIASKLIQPGGGGSDGTNVWIDCTPATTGVHHLYAQLQESPGDPQPGNNTATLDVNVFRNGDINGDGQVNKADLNLLLSNLGKSVESSSCGLLCDMDGDGRISVLDARKLVLMCNTAGCGGQ